MDLHQFLADAAAVATTLGFLAAAVAVYFGLESLRTEAQAARLESIITTNELWKEVSLAVDHAIELSSTTIESIQRAYALLNEDRICSVTAGTIVEPLNARVPFVAAALLPIGNSTWGSAPEDEAAYLRDVRRRALGIGFVRTVLAEESLSPWLNGQDRGQVVDDLQALDMAMTLWVGRMNEVAELYQEALLDRRLFVSKRSVTLIQQLFAAEPYILWRNSTTPGRWGLRPLGLGSEARLYHWGSPLQRAAIRLRLDPVGYSESDTYPGFSKQLGWIVGPGSAWARRIRNVRIDGW